MLHQIIDRRLAGKNKSIGNRERFLRRHKDQIREAVKRAVDGRGIRDIAQGEDIHIPKRDISEPVFGHGQGGNREMVHPGNQDYLRGDKIERPKGGGGGAGGGKASDSGSWTGWLTLEAGVRLVVTSPFAGKALASHVNTVAV